MSPELSYLAWTAALTVLLWAPFIVARSLAVEFPNPRVYRDPTPPEMPAYIKRMDRAHLNAIETLVPFAALVLIVQTAGLNNDQTALYAAVFFWARVAHAVVYWLGIPFARTLAFGVGVAATLGLAHVVLTAPVA